MTFDGATVRSAPYLSFDATVSRNSRFHQLTEAQRDELGGVEYRAIDMLSKLIPIYWLGLYFIVIVLVAPWLASKPGQRTRDVLAQQGQYGVGTTWFWFFQITSAYSNTGLSLIDTSMIQLNDQYMMLIPMAFMILAGNTAFPILLRLFVWLLSLMVPRKSRSYETLRFLLDHPRRCFIYLFPSAQTWFLLMVLVVLNSFDWIMFEILDLKNPTLDAFQTGVRVFDGLFQSIAVRAAGFQIVSLLVLAPAVQFLYIVMMYISAYPVAMSVRNTNVYEERSLGIFNEEADGEQDEPEQGGARVWGTYLAAHARRQLAFDMWWLGFALWLVCIIEKDNIQDPETNGWFTVFSCLFELTSAYGTVGLSTGTPVDNFSLSGRFHTLSKLVVIAVMLRGRHRGLPVAIDRAVLLPGDFEIADDMHERAYTIDEDGMIRSKSTYNPITTREHVGEYEAGYEDAAGPTSPDPLHASTASTTRMSKVASETPSASHQGRQYDGVAKRDSTDSDRRREYELTKQCCSAGEEVEEAKRGAADPV
jgi:potassium uptake Trk family protein